MRSYSSPHLAEWLRGLGDAIDSPDMSVRVSQLAHLNTVSGSLAADKPVSQCCAALVAASG